MCDLEVPSYQARHSILQRIVTTKVDWSIIILTMPAMLAIVTTCPWLFSSIPTVTKDHKLHIFGLDNAAQVIVQQK